MRSPSSFFHAADILTRGGSRKEGEGYDAMQVMNRHAGEAWLRKRAEPRDDMLNRIAFGAVGGLPVDAMQFALDFLLLVGAGSDTTRNVVGGGVLALAQDPEQKAMLTAGPALAAGAVEEMLRWTTPIVYQRRTVTRDGMSGSQQVRAGDKVVSYYCAANRDPRVFRDPDRFDITDRPNPHIAFGAGQHFCLGSNLARLELTVMLRELARRMPDLQLAGTVGWYTFPVAPALIGPASIPVRFAPGPRVRRG